MILLYHIIIIPIRSNINGPVVNDIFYKVRALVRLSTIVAEAVIERRWRRGVIVILLCADGVKYFSINEEFEVTAVITHRQYYILLFLLYLFDVYIPVICMMRICRVCSTTM